MTEHTTHLNLPYPDGSDGPDGAGQIAALALALDSQLGTFDLAAVSAYASGVGSDTGPGMCRMYSFGPIRIVAFSLFSTAGIAGGSLWAQMNAGNRPEGAIYCGASVYDAGSTVGGEAAMDTNGNISLVTWAPDSGSDHIANAIRGFFVYFATH